MNEFSLGTKFILKNLLKCIYVKKLQTLCTTKNFVTKNLIVKKSNALGLNFAVYFTAFSQQRLDLRGNQIDSTRINKEFNITVFASSLQQNSLNLITGGVCTVNNPSLAMAAFAR